MHKSELSLSICLEIPEKYIPHGYYCFDDAMHQCPFWDSKPNEFPVNEDGYCHFLNKSDWDINEAGPPPRIVSSKHKEEIGKTVDELYDEEIDLVSGKKIHLFGMSLLWDDCKECGVNLAELSNDEKNNTTYETK